jgi:trehalose 6-phosphate synthase
MNLVAKEYCASSVDNNGVLILSEFAGAADQLSKGALMANPYDIEGMADTIHRAYHMDADERRHRMQILRAEVRRNDVYRWVGWFLTAFGEHDFPSPDSPSEDEDEQNEVIDLGLWMGETRRSEKIP